jgi:hypothetical protein
MSIAWLVPTALAGVTLVLLPIAVHLLVRQQARVQAFPSLRFLRETQLAAFRRRRIEDATLLACRAAIILFAVIALTGPLVMTAARTAGHARRTSRAIVATDESGQLAATGLSEGAFRSITVKRAAVTDAIADAIRWLDGQPPSSREIVVVGRLSRGVITEGDLAGVPRDIGVRFVRSGSAASPDVTVPMLTSRDGVLTRIDRAARLSANATRVTTAAAATVLPDLIAILASENDRLLADAALRAVLRAGVPWSDFERRVLIVWDGADNGRVAARSNGTRVVRMPRPMPDAAAADAVRDVLSRASRPELVDSVAIADEQLAAWSRPAGPPSKDAPLSDEGDRRWMWTTTLALLALEWWLRERRSRIADVVAERSSEARVA